MDDPQYELTGLGKGLGIAGLLGLGFTGADLFRSGPERFKVGDSALAGQARRMSDPNYGLSQFQAIARQGPSLSDYFGMMQQRGGSGLQAQEAFQAGQAQKTQEAMSQYNRFRLASDENLASINQALAEMRQKQALANEKRRQEAIGGLGQGLFSLLGTLAGGPAGGAAGGALGGLFFRPRASVTSVAEQNVG